MAGAYAAAALLRFPPADLAQSAATPAGIALLVLGASLWLAALSARETYSPRTLVSLTGHVFRVLSAAIPAWVLTQLVAFLLKVPVPLESRLVVGISLLFVLIALPAVRIAVIRPIAQRVYPRLARGTVLVLGDSERADRIADHIRIHDARSRPVARASIRGMAPREASERIDRIGIGEVILVPDGLDLEEALDLAFACLDAHAEVQIASGQFVAVAGRSAMDALDGVPVMRFRRLSLTGPEAGLKRAVDFVGAACGLALLSPVLACIAFAVKISSPGPILFRQERIGTRGRRFTMHKFRTMTVGNDPGIHHEYIRSFIRDGVAAEVAGDGTKIFKLTNDPRVTPIGAFLRALSLDELPQLWNVIRGEMSLVGPRPCLPVEWDMYRPWQRRRLDVLPGCTGLWQVSGRSLVSFEEMVLLDLLYAHQRSTGRDLWLIAQTVPAMIRGRGGY